VVAGCGDKKLDKSLPQPKAQDIVVTGPWSQGGRIPTRYTCDGADRKPNVRATVPGRARDVAIVMTDPDAPGGTFVHWTHWGAHTDGRNSFGRVGYSGPCPPKGDKPHHYLITFYALRRPLGLAAGSAPDRVLAAIRKSTFASGSLTGLYSR
jgi:phosphatidylethanolamine-binding protein (PEBP) family uncharacterized protein